MNRAPAASRIFAAAALAPAVVLGLTALIFFVSGCNESDPVSPGTDTTPAGPPPYLEPEPPFSPGTENALSWSLPEVDKTAGWEFLIQSDSEPDFAGEVQESGWISELSFTFSNLPHGTVQHYRVRGRNERGVETEWSAVRTSTQDDVSPTSSLAEMKTEQTSLLFTFVLSASDETSGIRNVELWVGVDGIEPRFFQSFPPGEVSFQATGGGVHEFVLVAVDGAGNRQDPTIEPAGSTIVPEPIIITDLRGEDFDITSAVLEYRMAVTYWEYGVGRFTIRPLIDPLMIGPGALGYPPDANTSEILGLQFEDDVRAYLVGDIRNREVVDDVVNGIPVAVIYCPLCDSFGTYNRVLDGETLTIAASGWTWHDKFVLQDYETGSLWWTGLGLEGKDLMLCVAGPLQNVALPRVESFRGLWRPWVEAYPETKLLKSK